MQISLRASQSHHCLTVGRGFFSASFFILIPLDIPLINGSKKFQFCLNWNSTEQNPKASVVYFYDFEHFSFPFGSVVVYVLEFWHTFGMCLTVQAETPAPVGPSLAAGLLQSLKGFSEPAFSEIWLQPLIASFFCPVQEVSPLFL